MDTNKIIFKDIGAVKELIDDEEQYIVEGIASTEDKDRYGDVVVIEGIDTTSFMKNPLLLKGHDAWGTDPIGKVIFLEKRDTLDGKQLYFRAKLDKEDPIAVKLYQKIKKGISLGVSIGFIPKDFERLNEDSGYGYKITQSELLEISLVTIPANQNSVVTSVKSFINNKEMENKIDLFMDKLDKFFESDILEKLNKFLEQEEDLSNSEDISDESNRGEKEDNSDLENKDYIEVKVGEKIFRYKKDNK